jgi:hypothetical protein
MVGLQPAAQVCALSKEVPGYLALKEFLARIVVDFDAKTTYTDNFLIATREREFLFPVSMIAYLDEVHSKGLDLHAAVLELQKEECVGGARDQASQGERDLYDWFREEHRARASKRFLRYLDFRTVGSLTAEQIGDSFRGRVLAVRARLRREGRSDANADTR